MKRRRQTGEREVFLRIWEDRPHCCEVCRVAIAEAKAGNFSHILPKGTYPERRLDPANIALLCLDCHNAWHNKPRAVLCDNTFGSRWRVLFATFDELKRLAYT